MANISRMNQLLEYYKVLGKKIRKTRNDLGLTQEAMGKMIGYSRKHISSVENGHRRATMDFLISIEDRFQVKIRNMRSVTELSKLKGKVYVYLKDEVIANKFLRDAEDEGFTFCDGAKPTTRPGNNLYVVNKDWTISHVGMVGHIAYQSATRIGEERLIRIDYEEYILD